MKQLFTFILVIFINNLIFSQCNGRYETDIFNSVTKTTINYSDIYLDNEHTMDIYIPDGDTATNRPVIIYMHGGSFYAGDKSSIDCVDFCETMARRGYVTASLNYRLASNIVGFLTSNETQYETVLKAVYDAKAAVRYFRKEYTNGNQYGIDPNTIFAGGYSAGGVIAIHQAYIDNISDLPFISTDNNGSSFNVQLIANNIGGTYGIEGDAGNYGFSSKINCVINFAGGINNINWMDDNDEPLVSIQGTDDQIVGYACSPALNNPLVLDLCGASEMHPQADLVGIINEKLIFNGDDHSWASNGSINSKFIQAINFTSDFLYPLLPCNNSINEINENLKEEKKLVKIVNVLGATSQVDASMPLFYIYSDGSVEHKVKIK